MDIKATATHLQRLNQPFDVIIFKNGSEQTLYTNCAPTNVQGLLEDVVTNHQPERLIIQERKRNGSVNIKTSKNEINIEGVLTPHYSALSGFSGATPQPTVHANIPSDFKDYMIADLKAKADKLEIKTEKLENENYELKTERDSLKLEIKTKDKEFELSKKETELEQTNGLGGIIETVSTNPALANIAAMAIGRLMGIENPMQASEPIDIHEDTGEQIPELNKKVSGFVSSWIAQQDEKTTLGFYELMKLLSTDTAMIFELIEEHKSQSDE